jgi:hypothetical protein
MQSITSLRDENYTMFWPFIGVLGESRVLLAAVVILQ